MKALIVDDETPARHRMRRMLQGFPEIEIVGEAGDGKSALAESVRKKPDVIFLDIEMPELDGIEVAMTLGPAGPLIIFVTAFDEYAIKAFRANALDYLLKPIESDQLAEAIQRAQQQLQAKSHRGTLNSKADALFRRPRIALKTGSDYSIFKLEEISAIVAKDHYCEVVAGEKRVLIDDSLDSLENRLHPDSFLRIHRGSIINLDFLQQLRREGDRKYTAVLADTLGTELPVSRDSLEVLKGRISV